MGNSTKTQSNNKRNKRIIKVSSEGRPAPMTPKAGYTQTRRRLEYGGKYCK